MSGARCRGGERGGEEGVWEDEWCRRAPHLRSEIGHAYLPAFHLPSPPSSLTLAHDVSPGGNRFHPLNSAEGARNGPSRLLKQLT